MPAPITTFVSITAIVGGSSVDKRSFGTPIGVFDHTVNTDRQNGPYFSVAEGVAGGFTAAAEPEAHAWLTAMFQQGTGVDSVIIGLEAVGDATWTATMDAIELEDPVSFYLINIHSRAQADIELVAAWTEARRYVFIAQSSDAAILAGTPANVALELQTAAYTRTALIYHATDTEPLDGAWTSYGGGFDLDAPRGAGVWEYNKLVGIPFDPVTGPEATEIYDANANLFGKTKGVNFTSKGTTAVGAPTFIDVTVSIDWVTERTEEAMIAAFTSAVTKIAYDNEGIATMVAAMQGVLDLGVSAKTIDSDNPTKITVPDSSEVSQAQKQARELTMVVDFTLAGAIQEISITFNISF